MNHQIFYASLQTERSELSFTIKKQTINEIYKYLSNLSPTKGSNSTIRFVLFLDPIFISEGLGTEEIGTLFSSKGWEYTSRYISTAMTRNTDKVKIMDPKL